MPTASWCFRCISSASGISDWRTSNGRSQICVRRLLSISPCVWQNILFLVFRSKRKHSKVCRKIIKCKKNKFHLESVSGLCCNHIEVQSMNGPPYYSMGADMQCEHTETFSNGKYGYDCVNARGSQSFQNCIWINFDFWQFFFWFLREISIFEQIFEFWQKIRFLNKFSNFDKKFDFWTNFRILTKNSIFDKSFDFWQKFGFWQKFLFLTKVSSFDKSFDFWQKFRFLTKVSIFDISFDLRQISRYLTTILDPNFNCCGQSIKNSVESHRWPSRTFPAALVFIEQDQKWHLFEDTTAADANELNQTPGVSIESTAQITPADPTRECGMVGAESADITPHLFPYAFGTRCHQFSTSDPSKIFWVWHIFY